MPKFGATGKFPFGRIDASDDGELQMGIAADHQSGIVRVEFGTPTAWLGLPSGVAREFAKMLISKADELDARKS